MTIYCVNSITVEIPEGHDQHPLNVFDSLIGEDWLRRDAQVLMSVRVFAAGILGIFRIKEEPPFQLDEDFNFTFTGFDDPVADIYSKWLLEIFKGRESIVHCMMLHRELKHLRLRWGNLTTEQKDIFKRLIHFKNEDWGMGLSEEESQLEKTFKDFFNEDFTTTVHDSLRPKGSVRAFKPTDILKEINGEHGGLIKNISTAHDYHKNAFGTPSTDFVCFCTKDTSTKKEYLFETIEQPPVNTFVNYCKDYPDAKITIVSLIKANNTCIRYSLKGDSKIIHISEVTVVPENMSMHTVATEMAIPVVGEETMVVRCPRWLLETSLVRAF